MTKLYGLNLEQPCYNLNVSYGTGINGVVEEDFTYSKNSKSNIKEAIDNQDFIGFEAEIEDPEAEVSEDPITIRCQAKPVFYRDSVKWLLYHEKIGYNVVAPNSIPTLYLFKFDIVLPE